MRRALRIFHGIRVTRDGCGSIAALCCKGPRWRCSVEHRRTSATWPMFHHHQLVDAIYVHGTMGLLAEFSRDCASIMQMAYCSDRASESIIGQLTRTCQLIGAEPVDPLAAPHWSDDWHRLLSASSGPRMRCAGAFAPSAARVRPLRTVPSHDPERGRL